MCVCTHACKHDARLLCAGCLRALWVLRALGTCMHGARARAVRVLCRVRTCVCSVCVCCGCRVRCVRAGTVLGVRTGCGCCVRFVRAVVCSAGVVCVACACALGVGAVGVACVVYVHGLGALYGCCVQRVHACTLRVCAARVLRVLYMATGYGCCV